MPSACRGFQPPSRALPARRASDIQRGIPRRSLFSSAKIIRQYEELPHDYRDKKGIPFRETDLDEAEVHDIFGPKMRAAAANHLLRILHGRRVAGTLEDPAFAIHTAQFSQQQMAAGLAYLRQTVSVPEIMNAGLRAEDELYQLEKEREQAERKQKQAEKVKQEEDEVTVDYTPDPIYGRSRIDEIKTRNMAKARAEKALAQRRRAEEAEELARSSAGGLAKVEEEKKHISNPTITKYYEEAQSDLKEPPALSKWERILPSATVVVLAIGFLAAISMVYEEPMARFRLMREISTSEATVGTLIVLNTLVYLGWKVPQLWSLFNRYMIFVVATVKPATLFTATFSHVKLSHLLVNMVPLWFVGTRVHDEMGRANFLALYLSCGAMGFLGSLVTYTARCWLGVTSLGASGATLGLCSAYFWEYRNDGFRILGLPPDGVHGIIFLALITALQLAGLGRTMRLKVDVASHLVGMATGVVGIELINREKQGKVAAQSDESDQAVIELVSADATDGKASKGAT